MQAAVTSLAENFTGVQDSNLLPEHQRFSLDDVPDLSGKVAIVTGGSEGIGYATSHVLLSHNISKLFVVSKDETVYSNFKDEIAASLGDDSLNRVVWKQCELSSPKAVVATADEIAAETDKLHIMANVAGRGIMAVDLSPDGIDLTMATNHFGHAILISKLLPLLKKTSETEVVRVVNVSSRSHESAPGDVKFASLEEINKDHGPNQQYGQSKLANLLHARWLASHLQNYPNIKFNATHPGVVQTRQPTEHIYDAYPVLGKLLQVLKPALKDVFEGCVSTIWCATKTEQSGEYVCVPRVVEEGSPQSQDKELGESLMKLTKEVLLEKTGVTLESV